MTLSILDSQTTQSTVRAVADWLDQTTKLRMGSRANFRTDIVPAQGEEALRDALNTLAGPKRVFVVKSSRASDAVELRNTRGTPGTSTVCLFLWQVGSPEHAYNEASLHNVDRIEAASILGDAQFTLAEEIAVERRIRALAAASNATADHVVTVWSTLRKVLRDQARSVPLANRVDNYVRYLLALNPEGASTLEILVERWGAALSTLGLFQFPAIGRMLGVHSELGAAPNADARRREKRRDVDLRTELFMNQGCTIDFAGLADRIAGRGDFKVHMEGLDREGFRLSSTAPGIARRSFEEFCRSGDRSALVDAEWAWQDSDRKTQGVRGVLVQRRISTQRADPLEALKSDTVALLADTPLAETVPAEVDRRKLAEYDSPLRRVLIALGEGRTDDAAIDAALDELAIIDGAACRQTLGALLAADPQVSGRAAKLAVRWAPKLAEHASVRHPRLLEGVMRVIAARLAEGVPLTGTLVLTVCGKPRPELVWNNLDPVELSRWLTRLMEEDAREASDEDGDTEDPLRIQVALHRDRRVLGEIELDGIDLPRPQSATVAEVGGESTRILPLRLAALQDAWQAYQASWSSGRAPLPPAAEVWVQAWAAQVAAAGNALQGAASRSAAIGNRIVEITEAVDELEQVPGKEAEIAVLEAERKQLLAEKRALKPTGNETAQPAIDDETCREILQVCTFRDDQNNPSVIELLPHHPLCLRLRMARERLILRVLGSILSGSATVEGNTELRRWADEELGPEDLPVPLHSYGLVAHDPLLFDGWRAGGSARFQRPDRAGEAELGRLGLAPVTKVVRDYRQIFARTSRKESSGATDRLQLQVGGDSAGVWAWALVERLCEDQGAEFQVGLARAPASPSRPLDLDRATYDHPELFAPRRDGRPPRIILGTSPLTRAHMSLDVGEHLGFRGDFRSRPMGDPPPATDAALLFSAPLLRLEGSALAVADPADQLCAQIRTLIERVANGRGSTYTYDFDPDQHAERLRGAQGGAHWLVLVSRFPVHRAVQLAAHREETQGRPFASLIDFWTTRDRGRPLYVSCSLHAGGDALGDTALVDALKGLGLDLDLSAVLRAARSVAPKAAIALLRGQYRREVPGILGLLLTAAHARSLGAGERVLALDQHTGLLNGSGELSDLVCARLEEGVLRLRVVEAKFSAGALTPSHALPKGGCSQISNTIGRLKHFEDDHPLAARARRRLLDALADAATLAGEDAGADPLVAAAINLSVPIRVMPVTTGEVHAWALDGPSGIARPNAEASTFVHGGNETREALGRLAGGKLSQVSVT